MEAIGEHQSLQEQQGHGPEAKDMHAGGWATGAQFAPPSLLHRWRRCPRVGQALIRHCKHLDVGFHAAPCTSMMRAM